MSTIFILPTEPDGILSSESNRKQALRYGFHRTGDCKSFERSFLCIQKCVDLNYDVAHADKNCKCTCYTKQDRAKYKSESAATKTRWRSGAPKTSVPAWANPSTEKKILPQSGSDEITTEADITDDTDGTVGTGGAETVESKGTDVTTATAGHTDIAATTISGPQETNADKGPNSVATESEPQQPVTTAAPSTAE
ncbi:unnamed protein product, partial [Iphiclides podalirius]